METNHQKTTSPKVFADIRIDVAFKKAFGTERFKDADGNRFVVEMQRARQKTFQERMVFYASKIISTFDVKKGGYNYRIPFTYVVAFMDFSIGKEYFRDEDKCFLHYLTKETEYETKLPGSTEYYFFDLTRFNKSLDEITDIRDYWLYLLREVSNLEEIPVQVPKDSSFSSFFTAADRANYSEQENLEYEKAMMNELDYENSMITAREEGFDKGVEKGREEGRVEGRAEGKEEGIFAERIRMTKALKSKNIPVHDIAECTGLSVDEILSL